MGRERQLGVGGMFYANVPKGLVENAVYRREVLEWGEGDAGARRALWEGCRRDLLFYVNTFVWTYDPRLGVGGKVVPFVTFGFQDEAMRVMLSCIEGRRDLVIEKSRDMGASWMSLLVMEWLWHFHEGYSFLMVSRKEELVDVLDDMDSLFGKIDFVHRHLPGWLMPLGWSRKRHRKRLHFTNPQTGSLIDGTSTTAASGVGGRRTAMFIDEFSRIEEGYQLLAGTADTTPCRIFNFTPFGMDNAAYALARRGDLTKLRLHWSMDPRKNEGLYKYNTDTGQVEFFEWDDRSGSLVRLPGPRYAYPPDYVFVKDGKLRSPVYDAEDRRRANAREMAMMWDIDYQGSSYPFFDRSLLADYVRDCVREPLVEADLEVDVWSGEPLGIHPRPSAPLLLWVPLVMDGKPPRSEGGYAIGVDTSSGTGATNSCASVIDRASGEKVAEYATPFERPDSFAAKVVALCKLFRGQDGSPAMLIWESGGPGEVFGKAVLEMGYRNIWYRSSEKSLVRRVSDVPGWVPSAQSRMELLSELRTAMSTRQFLNRSASAVEECRAFVYTPQGVEYAEAKGFDALTGKPDPSGARANHGDRVIADALAWKLVLQHGRLKTRQKEAISPLVPGSLAWRRALVANRESAVVGSE